MASILKNICRKCDTVINCKIDVNCSVADELKIKCIKCNNFDLCRLSTYQRHGCFESRQNFFNNVLPFIPNEIVLYESQNLAQECPFNKKFKHELVNQYQILVDAYAPEEEQNNIRPLTAQQMAVRDLNKNNPANNISKNIMDSDCCINCTERVCESENLFLNEAIRRRLAGRVMGQ